MARSGDLLNLPPIIQPPVILTPGAFLGVPDQILAARYAWAADPKCGLYNKVGLPAPPFRTDDWKVATEGETAN